MSRFASFLKQIAGRTSLNAEDIFNINADAQHFRLPKGVKKRILGAFEIV